MSSSLQEQLVQAGLADEDSLHRARQGRKRRSGGRKGGGGKPRKGQRQAGSPSTKPQATAKPAPPAEASSPRPPTAEEKADQLRQIIRANRIDRAYAAVPYRFTEGARIREIAVTGTQQGRIARGELGVVNDGHRCELVPAKTARRIRGIDPSAVLVLNREDDRATDDGDDPYAAYRVPDDLMW